MAKIKTYDKSYLDALIESRKQEREDEAGRKRKPLRKAAKAKAEQVAE